MVYIIIRIDTHDHDSPRYSVITPRRLFCAAPTPLAACFLGKRNDITKLPKTMHKSSIYSVIQKFGVSKIFFFFIEVRKSI